MSVRSISDWIFICVARLSLQFHARFGISVCPADLIRNDKRSFPLSIYLVLMLLEGGKEEWGECGALPPQYQLPIINEGAPITPSPSIPCKWSWFIIFFSFICFWRKTAYQFISISEEGAEDTYKCNCTLLVKFEYDAQEENARIPSPLKCMHACSSIFLLSCFSTRGFAWN